MKTNFLILFELNENISTGDFTMTEIETAIKQMKNNKEPGLDSIPLGLWKLPKCKEILLTFCNATLDGARPPEWGLSAIVPVPKKGDLTKTDNYRGISLSQVSAKIYNRLILNRRRPKIDKVLRPNQNGFRSSRSTSSQILALRRIIEEMKDHKMEGVVTFIDFRKAFDSIDQKRMFKILHAYGIPPKIVDAIRIMYENNSATVLTQEGETEFFKIETGVLQGDPLAPFLFIIVLDYALRKAIKSSDGLTLFRQRSRRHPSIHIADLDFADDIALIDESIKEAERVLHKVELATQSIGLFLNIQKNQILAYQLNKQPKLQNHRWIRT
eukprot:TCONS_00011696-protein